MAVPEEVAIRTLARKENPVRKCTGVKCTKRTLSEDSSRPLQKLKRKMMLTAGHE